jgi:hypothetical protein
MDKDEAQKNPENTPESSQQSQQPQHQITIDIPKGLQAVYANMTLISYTPAEMVLDFAQVLPRPSRGTVTARVIMSPMHAKLLLHALGQNIVKFEQQYGEIRVPQSRSPLADHFFRFPNEGGGDDEQ